ncbi:hypothetical protein [Micropruina sp.]
MTELSRTAQMSRSAFAALFSDVVGSTPHDYLTSWRNHGRPTAAPPR